MSVTVHKQPNKVELSGSYLLFSASSSNRFLHPGEYFYQDIRFTGFSPAFTTWQFIWGNGEEGINLIFADTTTPLGYYIKRPVVGQIVTISEWITNNVIPAFESMYQLHTVFTITKTGADTIRIKARNKGTYYNITFGGSAQFMDYYGFLHGVDPVLRENLTVPLFIEFAPYGSTSFKTLDYIPHAVQGKVEVDLSESLKYHHTKLWPVPSGLKVIEVSDMVLKYTIKYCEAFGSPLQYFQMTKSELKYLLPGGTSAQDLIHKGRFQSRYVGDTSAWLTHRLNRLVSYSEPIFLYFMLKQHEEVYISATLHFDDGTSKEIELGDVEVDAYSLWLVKAGFLQIADKIPAGKNLTSWSVVVMDDDDQPVTNTATFEIDTWTNIDEIHVMYQNSLGMPDVFRFTGRLGYFTEFKKAAASLHISNPAKDTDTNQTHTSSSLQKSIEVSTQYMETQEINHLNDFLNSKYYFILQGDIRTPVTLSTGNLNERDSNSGRKNAHTFTLNLDPDNYA